MAARTRRRTCGGTRRLIPTGVLLLALLLALPAAGQEPSAKALEERILGALARGETENRAVERWLELEAETPGVPPKPRSSEAAELHDALESFLRRSQAATEPQDNDRWLRGLLSAYDSLRAADLLFRERFRSVGARLERVKVGPEVEARLAAAEAAYLEQRRRFLDPLDGPMEALRERWEAGEAATSHQVQAARAAVLAVSTWLEGHLEEEPPPILRAGLLPYRPQRLTPRPLVVDPSIQPSYTDPTDPEPQAEDLASTVEAPFSEAILRKAQELGHDYVRIYEFVRNEIDTEWYAGSMKGAEGTLLQGSGNDVDQASLLIALLRASQAPARYVGGVVELPIETLAADLGVPQESVTTALTRAGVAYEAVIRGGRIAAVQLEHTWVSLHVPYANYRGAVVDFSGPAWLPLFPAVKRYARTAASGVLGEMNLSLSDLLQEYLSQPQPEVPLELLQQRIRDHLQQNAPDETFDDQLAGETLVTEALRFLPSSLPLDVVAVTREAAELETGARHRVRIRVRAGSTDTDPVLLDHTAPLTKLLGARVTLSWQPATVDDHTTVNLFGGLDAVPLYLVQLRPQLMVAGRRIAVAESADEAGSRQRLEIELLGPVGRETVSQTVRSGGYYAMAFSAQRDRPRSEPEDDPADSEFRGARILSQLALGYSRRWGEAEVALARLLDVSVFRPLPALAVAGNAVGVETLLGLAVELRWQGVNLDAALRIAEPLSRTGAAAAAPDWMRFSGLQGSALEHFIFEEQFLVEGISADKGLGLARQAGIQVVRLDSGNVDALLPSLTHPAQVVQEIENWVRLGRVVEAPVDPISLNAWQGSVWRVEDEPSGASGYFIAGSLAGGATTEEPDSWILDFLADALEGPYSPEPNLDPLAGVSITKIGASDGQRGTVDEVLPTQLAVLVRDRDGRPVKDAAVEFLVTTGGGRLLDAEGGEAESVVALTDALGIAAVAFKLGKKTEDAPVFVLRNPGDEFATQALFNEVEAVALAEIGALVLGAPFNALAMPDDPAALQRTDPAPAFGNAGLWSDSMNIRADDRFGNPVSNVPVTFSVGAAVPTCDPPPANLINAAVFDNRTGSTSAFACSVPQPSLGECGTSSFSNRTSLRGAPAGVILGNATSTIYTVEVAAAGLAPLSFSYTSFGACNQPPATAFTTSFLGNDLGNNINAAKVGEEFRRPVQVTLMYSRPDFEVAVDSEGKFFLRYLPSRRWFRTTGNVSFSVTNGGFAGGSLFVGQGTYETRVTTGPTPGPNQVSFEATEVQVTVDRVNPDTGDLFEETVQRSLSGDLAEVFGLDPAIDQITPDPLILTDAGLTAEPAEALYNIAPSSYIASVVEMDLFEDDARVASGVGSSRSGQGSVDIQRGLAFDINKTYELELVLNRGSLAEVKSDRVPVPLRQRIFTNVDRTVQISQDVDLLNQRVCSIGSTFRFTLTQEATVSLKFKRIQSENLDGSLNFGGEEIILDEELRAPGDYEEVLTPGDLLPGDYVFELHGVSSVDGHEETEEGFARSEFTTRDSLPVGHVVVKGVDLFDGHLVVSRQDFQLPGRGVPLQFNRTYSSNAPTEGGSLGVGWSHSLGSKIVITPCGEAIVIGGQGSGQRFVDDGAGGLRPLSGFHGSLVANPEDSSFDFYSKNGSRDHFVKSVGNEWRLAFSADPNGNTTEYIYESTAPDAKLLSVRDSGGRTIDLHYERMQFRFWGGEVLTAVTASGGYAVEFEYDIYGNLIKATREGGIQIESYGYATSPENPLEERHLLISEANEINGASTSYQYDRGAIGIQGSILVDSFFVSRLTEPEGGETAFTYDLVTLGSRGPPEITTLVTDPRDKVTSYTVNQYGSPLRIVDPEGNETRMTWATDDVVMLSSTDGNGVTTNFTYDEHANQLSETVTVTNFDGSTNTYSLQETYWPPSAFNPPYLKTRVRTRTNRNGATTTFTYDSRGNLTREEITVETVDGPASYVTTHTYDSKGDRFSTVDPRGNTTFFSYDAYGNLTEVTDPEGGKTKTIWNVRSQTESQTDPLGRTTWFQYDSLNRLVQTTHPDGAIEATLYDDANRQIVETDAEGRVATTTMDLEGRPVRIVNAAGGTKLVEYDDDGNKTLESTWHDPGTARFDTTFAYDDAGRLITRTEPLGRLTTYAYDGVGNVISETVTGPGMLPRATETQYDALNRPIVITQHNDDGPVITRIKYDGEGNRILEVDPLGRETRSRYDGLSRLIEKIEPLGKITEFLFDGNDNLVEERRANSGGDQISTFEYDGNNRLVKRIDALGNETVLGYDPVGNLTQTIDPRLNVITFEYDSRDRPIKETVRLSGPDAITRFDYDRIGNLIEQILPNGNVVTRSYDGLDRLDSETDLLGPLSTFEYDARGNVLRQTDGKGNVTENTWDALDRLIEQRLPESRTLGATYDAVGNVLSRTDPRGNTKRYEYDRLNRRIKVVDPSPLGTTVEATYDAAGNKLSQTDRNGNTISFQYDDLNRMIRVVDPPPLATEQVFTYDTVGNRKTEIDRRGILTVFDWDKENRLVRTTRDGVVIETIEYDQNGNKRFITDANGNIVGFEYDERNLLTAENLPLAAITHFTLDVMGDIVEVRDPEGRIIVRDYDLRRRLISETNGAGETTTFSYDGNGNQLSRRRPEGNEWSFTYDGADRQVEVVNPLNETTTYGYDGNNNLVSVLDANGHETVLEYDERDRLTARVRPDGTREELGYDGNGNVTENRDAIGQVIRVTYDARNREVLRQFFSHATPTGDDLESIAVDYDANSNPLVITETYSGTTGTRTTDQTFDSFGRLLTVTDPQGKTLSYGYDANGNRTQLRDPDGRTTTYAFDALNRLDTVTMSLVGVTEYAYLRNSLLKSITYPSGSKAHYSYDLADRISRIENTQSGGIISSYEYEYDLNGNRTRQTEVNGGAAEVTSYSYDTADRLLEVVYPHRTTTYTYDAVGNRLTELERDLTGAVITDRAYSYDERNRLTDITDHLSPGSSVSYAWDANGNQVSKTSGGLTTDFRYDIRDQLIAVEQGSVSVGRFGYDYQGLRVRKETATGTLRYVYDDRSVLLQTDSVGNTIAKYDYGPDRLLSLGHATEPRQFYLFDALKSVVNVTRADGGVQARYLYDAWGDPRAIAGSSFNPFGFTGQERDEETGLYYFKARFYDPETGRFLTEDPRFGEIDDPPSLHRYLYAQSNPTVFVDPSGEIVETVWDAASLGIGLFSLGKNIKDGNWGAAALDALGVVADAAAVALPFVPGGAGAAIKAGRAAKAGLDLVKVKRGVDALQTADQLVSAGRGGVAAVENFEEGNTSWGVFNAAMATVGLKQGVSKANRLAKGTPSTPAIRKAADPPKTKTEVKQQARITGEAGKGGTNAASSVTRKTAKADPPTNRASADTPKTPAKANRVDPATPPRSRTAAPSPKQPDAARIKALRNAITDASGKRISRTKAGKVSTAGKQEIEGIKFTIGAVEKQGFRLVGAVKTKGNQGIDLLFEGVGENVGRFALAEAKRGKSLGSLARDTKKIRQGSFEFFRTRLEDAGRKDLVAALVTGQTDLFLGLARAAGGRGRLLKVNPTVFVKDVDFKKVKDAVIDIALE